MLPRRPDLPSGGGSGRKFYGLLAAFAGIWGSGFQPRHLADASGGLEATDPSRLSAPVAWGRLRVEVPGGVSQPPRPRWEPGSDAPDHLVAGARPGRGTRLSAPVAWGRLRVEVPGGVSQPPRPRWEPGSDIPDHLVAGTRPGRGTRLSAPVAWGRARWVEAPSPAHAASSLPPLAPLSRRMPPSSIVPRPLGPEFQVTCRRPPTRAEGPGFYAGTLPVALYHPEPLDPQRHFAILGARDRPGAPGRP
jgi:hypothetical protein